MPPTPPNPDFWRQRYRSGNTPWDLGGVSPAVRELARRWLPPSGRVFVPGCGRGYEALYLAARGYAVTAVDLVAEPLDSLRAEARRRGVQVQVRQGDLFDLPPAEVGAYDVLLEQTCLCALPPARHADYAALARRALRPGGQVLAVFMRVPGAAGPPYDLPPEAVRALFAPEDWEAEGPVPVPRNPQRPGPEYLMRFGRRG